MKDPGRNEKIPRPGALTLYPGENFRKNLFSGAGYDMMKKTAARQNAGSGG